MAHKILCVDDSPTIILSLRQPLEEAGFEVISASNGQEGIELLNKHWDVSLIYLDVNMPVMDGITLIKELRTLPSYKFTPLLMLTTESGLDKKTEGKAAGATGWIVKPFNPDQLLAVLKKVIR